MVRTFRRTSYFGLEPLGDPQPAGEATCHVAVDPLGRLLTAACWGDGQVLLYELDDDGGMTDSNIISALEVVSGGTELVPVKDTPSGGNWPRHHLVRGPGCMSPTSGRTTSERSPWMT